MSTRKTYSRPQASPLPQRNAAPPKTGTALWKVIGVAMLAGAAGYIGREIVIAVRERKKSGSNPAGELAGDVPTLTTPAAVPGAPTFMPIVIPGGMYPQAPAPPSVVAPAPSSSAEHSSAYDKMIADLTRKNAELEQRNAELEFTIAEGA